MEDMARYLTREDQYHCDRCDKWITEREMLSLILPNEHDTPGGFCPGCRVTKWCKFVTIGTDFALNRQRGNFITQAAQPGDTVVFLQREETGRRLMYMREPGENYG